MRVTQNFMFDALDQEKEFQADLDAADAMWRLQHEDLDVANDMFEDEPLLGEVIEEQEMELVCNECGHTFLVAVTEAEECPLCGGGDLDIE